MQGGYFKSKRVHIFINGRTQSKSFNIHPRCRLGWNSILDCLSKTLRPNFGAIRVLRTLDGRKVIEGFNDLQHEGKYVACGLEPYRTVKGGYVATSETILKLKPTEYYPTELLSPDDQKKYPCLVQTMRKGRIIIYVFANGKRADPKKVVLIKSDYDAWDSILKHIGNILDIPEGVKGMYTVFGQPLCSPYEIQHGGFYVAIPFSATFKAIKYLTARSINSHHESSPMITKETYIAAAKTCSTIGGPPKNRRRSKTTKVKDTSDEGNVHSDKEDKFEHHVKIEGIAIRRQEGKQTWESSEKYRNYLKRRSTPGYFHFGGRPRMDSPETVDQQNVTVDSFYQGFRHTDNETDVEVHESELHIANFIQKDAFAQTNALFFQATCDEDHALFFNQKKYFLVPAKQLPKFGTVDTSGWYEELLNSTFRTGHNEENKKEIEMLAGTMIGFIITASEKIVNKTFYGDSETEDTGEVSSSRVDIPQPKCRSEELVRDNSLPEHERRQSVTSKDRSLRLSVPIGRNAKENHHEHLSRSSSSISMDSKEIIHALDKDYTPLTPSHILGTSVQEFLLETSDDDLLNKKESSLLRQLRKDSAGIPTVDLESDQDYEDESEDEWRKLDILDDMGVVSSDIDIGDAEDLGRFLEVEEEDNISSDEYTFSAGEESIKLSKKSNSSYSNLHGVSEDEQGNLAILTADEKVTVQSSVDDGKNYRSRRNAEVTSKDDDDQDENVKPNQKSFTEDSENGSFSLEYPEDVDVRIPHIKLSSANEDIHVSLKNSGSLRNEDEYSSNNMKEELKDSKDKTMSERDAKSDGIKQIDSNEKFLKEANEVVTSSEHIPQVGIDTPNKSSRRENGRRITPPELVHKTDTEGLEEKNKLCVQRSTGGEASSVYSKSDNKLEPAAPAECTKPRSLEEIIDDRRATVNTWDSSVERVLRNKFDDDSMLSNQGKPIDQPEKERSQGADNKNISSECSPQCSPAQNIEKDRRALLGSLKMRIEIALNTSLTDLSNT